MGRMAFNMGVILLLLAIMPLAFLEKGSAEFIVDVTALVIISIFLILVVWDVRRQTIRGTR